MESWFFGVLKLVVAYTKIPKNEAGLRAWQFTIQRLISLFVVGILFVPIFLTAAGDLSVNEDIKTAILIGGVIFFAFSFDDLVGRIFTGISSVPSNYEKFANSKRPFIQKYSITSIFQGYKIIRIDRSFEGFGIILKYNLALAIYAGLFIFLFKIISNLS